MSHPESKAREPHRVTRKLWRGILEFQDEDVSPDRRAFNAFGKSAILWLEQSRELHRSAHRLMQEKPRDEHDLAHLFQAPIALMLGAYALETLLKMVIVGAHGDAHGMSYESVSAGDFLPTVHDLEQLAQRAALRINKTDRKLLKQLTRYSTWAGRYPIPRHYAGYEGPALAEAVATAPDPVPREHPVWPAFVALYEKIHKLAVRKTFRGHRVILDATARRAARAGKTVQRRD